MPGCTFLALARRPQLAALHRPQPVAHGSTHNAAASRRFAPLPKTKAPSRSRLTVTAAFDGGRGNNQDLGDRIIASLPYLLPLLDAIPFGKFIFLQYPFIARGMAPLAPLVALYSAIPFAPFIAFLAVYGGEGDTHLAPAHQGMAPCALCPSLSRGRTEQLVPWQWQNRSGSGTSSGAGSEGPRL